MDADSQFSDPTAVEAKARHNFPTFYLFASPEEESLMLTLMLARHALLITAAAPRRGLGEALRTTLERATDGVDATFTIVRDTMRACPAFARMDDDERARLETEVLNVSLPEEA